MSHVNHLNLGSRTDKDLTSIEKSSQAITDTSQEQRQQTEDAEMVKVKFGSQQGSMRNDGRDRLQGGKSSNNAKTEKTENSVPRKTYLFLCIDKKLLMENQQLGILKKDVENKNFFCKQ